MTTARQFMAKPIHAPRAIHHSAWGRIGGRFARAESASFLALACPQCSHRLQFMTTGRQFMAKPIHAPRAIHCPAWGRIGGRFARAESASILALACPQCSRRLQFMTTEINSWRSQFMPLGNSLLRKAGYTGQPIHAPRAIHCSAKRSIQGNSLLAKADIWGRFRHLLKKIFEFSKKKCVFCHHLVTSCVL